MSRAGRAGAQPAGAHGDLQQQPLRRRADGAAGETDGRFFADLDPAPLYDAIVRAHGGHADRVERPDELPGALARARDAVTNDGRQALLNVVCPY